MNAVDRRHVLVVAVQCKNMPELTLLRDAAHRLRDAFLDHSVGACEPGLPSGEAVLYGELTTPAIEAEVKAAIGYAAERGATLVLALLGHGFIAGTDPALYLMGRDSQEGVRDSAVDVRKLLVEATDRQGVRGVIGIIDTCTAAGAQPPAAELATGTLGGQTRLSLLMASAVDQPAYNMSLSRNLTELFHTGIAGVGPRLRLTDLTDELKAVVDEQNLVSYAYDGDQSSTALWFAHNLYVERGMSRLGQSGTTELLTALEALYPDRKFPAHWDLSALYELRPKLDSLPNSPAHMRVERIINNLTISQKTISFLRSFMAGELSTQGLRRALAALSASRRSSVTAITDGDLVTEVDAVEYVALTYPRAEGSCRAQMARFVMELVDDAGLDLDSTELRDWARSIDAIVAFNDVVSARRERRSEMRLRLIVGLHYTLTGDWPEEIGTWLLYDNEFYKHKDFSCPADQSGIESAIAEAVDWAEDNADELGAALQRIEIAMPAKLLLRWHPEEMVYGSRLGVNYEVLTHWSQRLAPLPAMRRINRNALRRLKEISTLTGSSRIHWLAAHEVNEPTRLCEELRAGRYTRAIGLMDNPVDNDGLLDLLLQFAPILLWPQTASLSPEHCLRVDNCWNLLPTKFLEAYRDRWSTATADLVADLRAVWDDEDWLEFCRGLQIQPGSQPRSA